MTTEVIISTKHVHTDKVVRVETYNPKVPDPVYNHVADLKHSESTPQYRLYVHDQMAVRVTEVDAPAAGEAS